MITIYGAGGDLIEVEGDIREEFNVLQYDEQEFLIGVSTGALLRAAYTAEGEWHFRIVREGRTDVKITRVDSRGEQAYSDLVEIGVPPRLATDRVQLLWVMVGSSAAVLR